MQRSKHVKSQRVRATMVCSACKQEKGLVSQGQPDGFTEEQASQGQKRKCTACVRRRRTAMLCKTCGLELPEKDFAERLWRMIVNGVCKRCASDAASDVKVCAVCGELKKKSSDGGVTGISASQWANGRGAVCIDCVAKRKAKRTTITCDAKVCAACGELKKKSSDGGITGISASQWIQGSSAVCIDCLAKRKGIICHGCTPPRKRMRSDFTLCPQSYVGKKRGRCDDCVRAFRAADLAIRAVPMKQQR